MAMLDPMILKGISLFQPFNDKEISAIGSVAVDISYDSEYVIFREGETGDDFFIIVTGEVEIVKEAAMGRKQLLTVLEQGSFFGEMSLLDGSPRSATAIAGEAGVELINIKKRYLEELATKDMNLVCKLLMIIIKSVSERLRLTSEHLLFSQRTLKAFEF